MTAVLLATAAASACSPAEDRAPFAGTIGTSASALVQTVDRVWFYPPLGVDPVPTTGTFDASLLARLRVRLESTSSSGETRLLGTFDSRTSPALVLAASREFYLVNLPATTWFTDSRLAYRVRVQLDGAEIGWADVTPQLFTVMAWNPATVLGVKLRIELRPAPVLATIAPTSAPTTSGVTLTVTGSSLASDSVVRVAGRAYATRRDASGALLADIPQADLAAPGGYAVTVFTPNPGGGESAPATLTIYSPNAQPVIEALEPAAVRVGAGALTLSVSGNGFVTGSTILFDGAALDTVFVKSTLLTASLGSSRFDVAGTRAVSVVSPAPGGGSSGTLDLVINNPPVAVASISPSALPVGSPGFTLTIDGSGFVPGAAVTLGGAALAVDTVSASRITAVVAVVPEVGAWAVTVANPAPAEGTGASTVFTVNAASCNDGVKNGAESDVDCGGACYACQNARVCLVGADCISGQCVSGQCGHSTPLFFDPVYHDLGGNELTRGVAVGDVTGDGRDDVVVSYGGNRPGSYIATFAQDNTGGLESITRYTSYDIPEAVAIGDVDFDGRNDVLTVHGGWNALGVYFQVADTGALAAEQRYALPYASHYNPRGLAVGDINGDGRLDVAIADYNQGLVVLRNRGGDRYTGLDAYTATDVGSWPEAVAIGDVNDDGRNDVVMTTSFYFDAANDYKVFVFLQNASGQLDPPIRYAGGTGDSLALGDVTGDGRIDVVVSAANGMGVLAQNATGSLDPMVVYPSNHSSFTNAYQVILGDFDHDGWLDAASIDWGTQSQEVDVYLQGPGGRLGRPYSYAVTHGGYDALAVGDANGDGLTDIIVMSGQSFAPNIGVLLQRP